MLEDDLLLAVPHPHGDESFALLFHESEAQTVRFRGPLQG
jgi:hypothetical protein